MMAAEQSGEYLRLARRATAARQQAGRLVVEQPSAEVGLLEEALRLMESGLWTAFVLALADEYRTNRDEARPVAVQGDRT